MKKKKYTGKAPEEKDKKEGTKNNEPRMLPNLSNLSTAAVKSKNRFFKEGGGEQPRLKLSNSIRFQRSNKKQK